MQSKNKRRPDANEREHIALIKEMDCGVCGAAGPSEVHEIEQGKWGLALPLCPSCHRDSFNGLHGQRRIWKVLKKDELSVLNETILKVLHHG